MDFELHKIPREIQIEGFNSIYYFEFGKDFSHPPEKHDFWEMVYVDAGEISAVTDGLGQTLCQGQVIFHSPGEIHAHVSNKKVSNNMLVVSFTANSSAMTFFNKRVFTLDKTGKTLLSLFINESKNALGVIPGEYTDKNALDFSSAPKGSVQLLECYLTELLLVLFRSETDVVRVKMSQNSRELAQSSITSLITEYLKENVRGIVTIDDICARFYMGKSKLCKLFDEYVGMGPIEYHISLKINEAKRMLLNEELSVSKISELLGYSTIHNFSRAFKKQTGSSPLEYRKKLNQIN